MIEYDPIKTLIIDADHVAHLIEGLYGDFFKQPTPAIYVQGEDSPRIKLDALHQYRQLSGGFITKLDDIVSPVTDRHDITVITAMDIGRGFSLTPTTPWIGRRLVEETARDAIEHAIVYEQSPGNNADTMLMHWLHPRFRSDIAVFESIRNILMDNIYEQVASFVQGPTWKLHTVRRIGCDVLIEKYDDFRIYEYHRVNKIPYMKGN